MAWLTRAERNKIELLAELTYTNPFVPERIALERRILGRAYRPTRGGVWSFEPGPHAGENTERIRQQIEELAEVLRLRLVGGARGDDREYQLYDDLVLHLLYFRMDQGARAAGDPAWVRSPAAWAKFQSDHRRYLDCGDIAFPSRGAGPHLYAMIDQIHRAFHNIFHSVIGRSGAVSRLRAAIWQSIFTHDIRRYHRSLYRHMNQIATLIIGPSGTGKELVASAVGRSQYVPFDPRNNRFAVDSTESFFALHLAALPTTLVESELFGHVQGAYTGAVRERKGWLEVAGPNGAVFLDEVGEIDASVQVKLLRVLQNRTYQRLGEVTTREFVGKFIAATNRDLRREIERGAFRQDLFFRLCADVIRTPTLREQLSDVPEDLEHSIRFIARQLADSEADALTAEVLVWIERQLPRDYAWPGNFRELEQCVRNILVHNAYDFGASAPLGPAGKLDSTAAAMETLELTAEEVARRYCTYAFWRKQNYEAAAEQLKLDRRTLRSKVDAQFLKELES